MSLRLNVATELEALVARLEAIKTEVTDEELRRLKRGAERVLDSIGVCLVCHDELCDGVACSTCGRIFSPCMMESGSFPGSACDLGECESPDDDGGEA